MFIYIYICNALCPLDVAVCVRRMRWREGKNQLFFEFLIKYSVPPCALGCLTLGCLEYSSIMHTIPCSHPDSRRAQATIETKKHVWRMTNYPTKRGTFLTGVRRGQTIEETLFFQTRKKKSTLKKIEIPGLAR